MLTGHLFFAGSQMADRITALEAEKAALESRVPAPKDGKANKATAAPVDPVPSFDDPGLAQLRLDLAEAIRSRNVSEKRLQTAEAELITLRAKTKTDSRSLRQLDAERTQLTTRLKDRDHELREKRKLLEDVQDETITLNLQLAMIEKERDKIKKDNQELVDRWMKRKAQEAEAMNRANEPTTSTSDGSKGREKVVE